MNSSDWQRVKLEEIKAPKRYAFVGGPFGSNLVTRDYVEQGVPVIRGANLSEGSRFSLDDLVFVSEEKADELLPNNAHPGDLVFTQRGTLGQIGIIPRNSSFERFVISQSQMKLTVDESKADPIYVYYFFRSPESIQKIHNLSFSSGVPHINLQILREFEIDLPPLPTQRRIAEILSAYDDLIEVNTRRIRILEGMAQSVYREWFGKVDVESMPEGWEVGKLEDALVLQRGFDLPTQDRQEGDVPIFASTGITGTHNVAKVKAPGVVTGRSGSLGTVIYVDKDFWPLNTTLWVKEFRRVTPLFAYYLLRDLKLEQFNSGVAVPTLNRNDIHGMPVNIPPRELLEKFDEIILPMHSLTATLQKKNANLRKTRDLLLPRLVGGEVGV